MSVEIRINSAAGHVCTIRGEQGWLFRELKAAVRRALDLNTNCFQLFRHTVEITSTRFLHDLPEDSTIELTLVRREVDRRLALRTAIRDLSYFLHHFHPLLGDREFISAAITAKVPILQYATAELRADRDLVMLAASLCPRSLRYAVEELKGDRAFVQDLMFRVRAWERESVLEFIAPELKNDHDFVLFLADTFGPCLSWSLVGDKVQRECRNHGALWYRAL